MNEAEYWDFCAEKACKNGQIYDNFVKRKEINKFLSNYDFKDRKVVEIGTGFGVSAAILKFSYGTFNYTGVDISPKFMKIAKGMFKHNMKLGSILDIPIADKEADDILLLDVLEHIEPEKRKIAYGEIKRILNDNGRIFINSPCDINESGHYRKFEFGYTLKDLYDLMESVGVELYQFQKYMLNANEVLIHYNFIAMGK